jgi:hypothetical protein
MAVRCVHADCPIPEVRVPSGTNLRCGCGKTVVSLPPLPPPPPLDKTADLQELLTVLRRNRVQQYSARDLTLVLHPSAWEQAAPERPATMSTTADPIELCSCGCDLNEHTQAGCIHGCDIDKCGRAEEQAA